MKQIGLLLAAAIFMFMINIDYTAVNLALVTISSDLHTDLNTIQWLLSGYALAWAAAIVPAGKLADNSGRKRMALFGLLLFVLGSFIAGAAHSALMVILGRILQGFAGAFAIPTIYGFLHENFPPNKIGMALGILSLGIGFGMAVGPTFGGVVLTYFGWRWIFFLNIPLGVLIVILLFYSTHESIVAPNEHLDKLGAILLSVFMVLFLYTIGHAHQWNVTSLNFLSGIVASLLVMFLFVWRLYKSQIPLIPLNIFKNRSFLGSSITLAIEQFCFSAVLVALALYLQKILGYSVLNSSLIFLALSLMTGIISPIGGYLVSRWGYKYTAILGLSFIIIGCVWLTILSINPRLLLLIIPLMIFGAGMGIGLTSLQTGALASVSKQQIGVASAVFVMLSLIGNSMGVLITTLVYEVASKNKLIYFLNDLGYQVNVFQEDQLKTLVSQIGEGISDLSSFPPIVQNKIIDFLVPSLNYGFDAAMIVSAILLMIGVIFFIFYSERN